MNRSGLRSLLLVRVKLSCRSGEASWVEKFHTWALGWPHSLECVRKVTGEKLGHFSPKCDPQQTAGVHWLELFPTKGGVEGFLVHCPSFLVGVFRADHMRVGISRRSKFARRQKGCKPCEKSFLPIQVHNTNSDLKCVDFKHFQSCS